MWGGGNVVCLSEGKAGGSTGLRRFRLTLRCHFGLRKKQKKVKKKARCESGAERRTSKKVLLAVDYELCWRRKGERGPTFLLALRFALSDMGFLLALPATAFFFR